MRLTITFGSLPTVRGLALPLLMLFLLAFGILPPAGAADLSVSETGQTVREFSVDELGRTLPVKAVTAVNPADSKRTTYQGTDLVDLLNAVFGEPWKRYDAIKFISRDGYRPLIPTASLLRHRGLLAFREQGTRQLSPFRAGRGETIDPGPLFLVWENVDDREATGDPWLSWPWQLRKIELTRFDREYPKSAPPANASEAARRGFTSFLQHCSKCHKVNGEGADIGPELNVPASVTEYRKPEWLARFIADPASVRPGSKMVGFYPGVQNREAIIRDIIEYLTAMAGKKIKPGS